MNEPIVYRVPDSVLSFTRIISVSSHNAKVGKQRLLLTLWQDLGHRSMDSGETVRPEFTTVPTVMVLGMGSDFVE